MVPVLPTPQLELRWRCVSWTRAEFQLLPTLPSLRSCSQFLSSEFRPTIASTMVELYPFTVLIFYGQIVHLTSRNSGKIPKRYPVQILRETFVFPHTADFEVISADFHETSLQFPSPSSASVLRIIVDAVARPSRPKGVRVP